MAPPAKTKRMKKELGLLSVYALATGATLSSGFFLLPGIAFREAGPATVLCYLIAAIPLIPAMFSSVELGTAMPRAGGAYYFLDRSMGPFIGTIGGMGTWLALMLKTAFALIGMGAYVSIFVPKLPIIPAAAGFAVLFAAANLLGAKKTGSVQAFLVAGLLAILLWFIGSGLGQVNLSHFAGFFAEGSNSILGTAGLVYISYVGVTNVASVSEEVRNPERNLPLGVFLAVATAIVVYGLGTFVMIGVIPAETLGGVPGEGPGPDLHPVATCARLVAGPWGAGIVTVAALLAFFAVANAGILSASRYPLAMSRDHLLPSLFRRYNKRDVPDIGIYTTLGIILLILVLLDVTKIAKLASAFQLLLFAFLCAAVIVMRESRLDSYDPGYRSPFYPWMQIIGIIVPCALILEMGPLPSIFSAGLIAVGAAWYFYYARERVVRHGAIYHVFERLGRRRYDELDRELRGILKEKGLRTKDPFDDVIIHSPVLDLDEELSFEEVTKRASAVLCERIPVSQEDLAEGFLQGTGIGATPVSHGAALPHLRLADLPHPQMVIVRSIPGVRIEVEGPLHAHRSPDEPVHAIFFLVSPEGDASQHLRILAQLARHIDGDDFISQWLAAGQHHELREILLRDERFLSLDLRPEKRAAAFIGRALRALDLPHGCLVALIRRDGANIVPGGDTMLEQGDRLTIIGEPKGIRQLYRDYGEEIEGHG